MRHFFAATTAAIAVWLSAPPVVAQEVGVGLGIYIHMAGNTRESVHAFIEALPPETQRVVMGGCRTVLEYPASSNVNTYRFCQLAQ